MNVDSASSAGGSAQTARLTAALTSVQSLSHLESLDDWSAAEARDDLETMSKLPQLEPVREAALYIQDAIDFTVHSHPRPGMWPKRLHYAQHSLDEGSCRQRQRPERRWHLPAIGIGC